MRVAPWFEVDEDSYPEEESMERLRAFLKDASPQDAARFMLSDFKEIVDRIHFARAWWEEWPADEISVFDSPPRKLCFATGGWSGAEELIETLLDCFFVATFHTLWRRGGYYEFEIPTEWAAAVVPQPTPLSRACGPEDK